MTETGDDPHGFREQGARRRAVGRGESAITFQTTANRLRLILRERPEMEPESAEALAFAADVLEGIAQACERTPETDPPRPPRRPRVPTPDW